MANVQLRATPSVLVTISPLINTFTRSRQTDFDSFYGNGASGRLAASGFDLVVQLVTSATKARPLCTVQWALPNAKHT